ncbi:hypothetical protein PUNSTDRAFT_121650 [Punctularia strigosozonata HHB-11173 SS5]|uniref:uncharacterized protein n=1 Tax=Punctularia strigosozonata (strain HHB-11173) TaxID=741275 RepID=UPI000441774E|nr:uncharacterized protein PUNSTDRAFT_121650 [Punctularia strigosozonata HHB-11173 SS5]EIN06428.1 hypothetical protein PUNSTDRAFT_121650 [Punctularia strigosozonata HHB-11173 SS5]
MHTYDVPPGSEPYTYTVTDTYRHDYGRQTSHQSFHMYGRPSLPGIKAGFSAPRHRLVEEWKADGIRMHEADIFSASRPAAEKF